MSYLNFQQAENSDKLWSRNKKLTRELIPYAPPRTCEEASKFV